MKQQRNLPIVYYIILGKDSCNGDSGGPLMSYNGDFKGTKYLRGIVSFGTTTCGNVRKQNIIIHFHKSILQRKMFFFSGKSWYLHKCTILYSMDIITYETLNLNLKAE